MSLSSALMLPLFTFYVQIPCVDCGLTLDLDLNAAINLLTLDLALGCKLFSVPDNQLQIGEVAALAGVTVDAVRYYEKRQLLTRAPRSIGNFRLFTPDAVERIHFIKQAQEIGLSLDEIKLLLDSDGGAPQCQRVRDLLKEKISEIENRMKKLREFKRTLSHHLSACEDELRQLGTAASCPVIVKIKHTPKRKR
jgi:DNA-binding transcriptional MerR regulator